MRLHVETIIASEMCAEASILSVSFGRSVSVTAIRSRTETGALRCEIPTRSTLTA